MSEVHSSSSVANDTDEALAQIERTNTRVNAMMAVCADEARASAAELEREREQGRWQGLLHGMPIAIKDNIETAGLRTTSGSAFFADHVPNQDAPTVARLRSAGAVIVGKTMLHEFAFGIRSNNSVAGQCHNPWNLTRIPGGSSGGSAAAIAAGMCAGALGSDTGGSVRLPAAMCGVSGLRPTHGRIANTGSTPVCPSQDTIGPMARSAADVARLFAVLAGYDESDPWSVDRPLHNFLPALADSIEGTRIGICRAAHFTGANHEVLSAVEAAIEILRGLGATFIDIDLPGFGRAHDHASVMIFADACAFHAERLRKSPELFDEQVRKRMSMGLELTGVQYAEAFQARKRWQAELRQTFKGIDVLLSPTVHTPVPPIDDDKSLYAATRDATRNTYAGAFGQIPGLSVPCGFADGMPVGLQLEGPWWSEPLLLRLGHAYQQITDWHLRKPPL